MLRNIFKMILGMVVFLFSLPGILFGIALVLGDSRIVSWIFLIVPILFALLGIRYIVVALKASIPEIVGSSFDMNKPVEIQIAKEPLLEAEIAMMRNETCEKLYKKLFKSQQYIAPKKSIIDISREYPEVYFPTIRYSYDKTVFPVAHSAYSITCVTNARKISYPNIESAHAGLRKVHNRMTFLMGDNLERSFFVTGYLWTILKNGEVVEWGIFKDMVPGKVGREDYYPGIHVRRMYRVE